MICAVLIGSQVIKYFWDEVSNNKFNLARFKSIKLILISLLLGLLIYSTTLVFVFINYNFYPQKAVEYLKKLNFKGNLFSLYDYGGYLIWIMPERKVYIDGRMPSWRRDRGPVTESNYAFDDYLTMISDEKYLFKQIKKYNITYILIPKPKDKNKNKTENMLKFEKYIHKLVYGNIDKHVLNEDLTKVGMIKIYDDGNFIIYKTNLF
jgi:hypothetical protein